MSDRINDDDEKLIKDHEYDGIQELDNPLPRWWLTTFYLTIIYAIAYFAYYQIFGGPDSDQQLARAMTVIESQRAESVAQQDSSPIDVEALLGDSAQLAKGKEVFESRCAACHGGLGEGLIGPNLTDQYWIHGTGDFESIRKITKEGVPAKGMPPWESLIDRESMIALSAYVLSIQGSNPPNAKEPQGELVSSN